MNDFLRRKMTKTAWVSSLPIGGGHGVVIQSMTNTDTRDLPGTVRQIRELEEEGCQLIRVSVPDMESAKAIAAIKTQIHIPLVADIHFDYRLALAAIEYGADALRLNPGNIGSREKVEAVVAKAKEGDIAIRIGINGGSLEKAMTQRYEDVVEAMVQSALSHIRILESLDFHNIVVSLKSSDVLRTVAAYRRFSEVSDYPLHVGVTEAGTIRRGTVLSSLGIGSLLMEGIGDTIRVSLTAPPREEILVAKDILRALGLYKKGIQIISCPTCARTKIDLLSLTKRVEEAVRGIEKPLTLAIMGCAVNGPGEASEADLGIAGGMGEALLFKKGKILGKIKEEDIEQAILKEIATYEMEE